MAMTYGNLTGDKTVPGSIKSWVNYAKVDAENVLMDAQTTLYQTLRVREMKSTVTLSITAGQDNWAVPDGFMTFSKFLDVTNGCEIEHKSWDDLEWLRDWNNGDLVAGDPTYCSFYNEKIEFDVKTARAITGRLSFYKMPALLSSTNPSNFLCTRYPHLLRTACLAMAAVHFKDNVTYAQEIQRMSALVVGVNAQNDLDDHAGQDIQMIG